MVTELRSSKDSRRVGGERRDGDAESIAFALGKNGRIALRVHGTSMLPWVKPGDVALIRHADNAGVRFGDVAVYRRANHIYVHRIVSKSGPWHSAKLTAKGDAHPNTDGELGRDELLGRVVRIYREGLRIDLDSPGQLALGLLIARLSRISHYFHPVASAASFLYRPIRHLFATFRAPDEVPQ